MHIKLDLHTKMLEALRETQIEQGREIRELRTEVRETYSKTATGMAEIITLIKNPERN